MNLLVDVMAMCVNVMASANKRAVQFDRSSELHWLTVNTNTTLKLASQQEQLLLTGTVCDIHGIKMV